MTQLALTRRRGARRRAEVPKEVLQDLEKGETETVNLMEWLAADMSALSKTVAKEVSSGRLRTALLEAADEMVDVGITGRLKVAGAKIAGAIRGFDHSDFHALAVHRSDLVRQWACYAVNHPEVPCDLKTRLALTHRFASDSNMSVREAAWMAFRPHLTLDLKEGVRLLKDLVKARNDNLRRFCIEVTRPRSVWGSHIDELKRKPHICVSMLNHVRRDDSRYVRLAAGNWLNDASKSQPDWVTEVCLRWMRDPDPRTTHIVRRALRTVEPTSALVQVNSSRRRTPGRRQSGRTPC